MTTNIGINQRTSLFRPFTNAKQPQIYIQDKALWYLFKISCITVGGIPIHKDPGGQNSMLLQKINTNINSIQIMNPINEFLGETLYSLSTFAWDTIITHKNIFTSRQETSMNGNIRPGGGGKRGGREREARIGSWRDLKCFYWLLWYPMQRH